MTHTGRTRTAGVIGWPVTYSRSPQLHGHWLARYGIDGAFVPFAVSPERVGEAVRGLRALGLVGASVTVPHKQAVMAHLDRIEPAAARIGAVNTILVEEDGTLFGRNTDAIGFMTWLNLSAPGWTPDGPQVVVGAGGAARAILVALAQAGASTLRLVNRSRDKADALVEALAGAIDLPIEVVAWEHRQQALGDARLLVNATTQGMEGHPPLGLDVADLPGDATVYDIVYLPEETPLLAAARARGLACVDGVGMLLHQARRQFEGWFGRDPEVDDTLKRAVMG